jgi:uncharacterized protein YcbK (DUF882 family)
MTIHFKDIELSCKCGCNQNNMEASFLDKLEALRVAYAKPIVLNSAYRCEAHNKAVGGAKGSQHVKGNAADLCTQNLSLEERDAFLALCKQVFINAIPGPGFVHCDEGSKRNWSY